ncbi:ABC-type multidrug transport system fused ATPase/permease subunit [Streptomyces candidus]|uniref:ABC-type multidrug transport system fused ATPase/permease subunit n=1 Tax=Streptomyces candidus TaxID=67283 RepID=A0A7X0HDX9_9ACTN|nr:ABC-type multidrug transport system fused ATPase/permease subunit [Streptomyces candidus]GHH42742.1 hypothetical protein GCM10018773_27610 [Streptomyces candidus]
MRRDGRRFFARRKGVLARLAAWSLVESAQTFLGGYCLAQALDQGFLAGRPGAGTAWLSVAALAILAGGPVARGVFAQLAHLVEPFRDALVRRAVDQALRSTVTGRYGTATARPRAATGAPSGTAPTGTAPTGTAPTGTAPTGTAPTGTAPTDTTPVSENTPGTAGTATTPALAAPAGTSGVAVSRLSQQSEIARDSFAGLVLTARSFVFTAVGALAGMFALAPELLLVTTPPLVLGLGLFLATLRPMAGAQRAALDAEEDFTDRVRATAAGLRDAVACGVQPELGARVVRSAQEAERAARVLARWAGVRVLALGVAGQLPPVLLLLAVPWLLDRGLTAGVLTGALTYLVQSLLPALHTLMTALGAAGTRLLVVLDRFARPPEDGDAPKDPVPDPRPTPPLTQEPHGLAPGQRPTPRSVPELAGPDSRVAIRTPAAELRAVTLAYGPGARPVLDGLSLTVGPDEHLAVVGPSGVGKSTLANVLAGLLVPGRGSVLLGGHPLRGRTPAELARWRALVPQQAYVFTASLRDNLTHLRPGTTDAELAEVVEALHLGPLTARLGGLDAPLVPAQLSEGEAQLLTLARAHLSPAPLLVLDEATCHLDQEWEGRAERALAARPGALVVVAHRMSSALRADRVLVLDGTRVDCGTHAELLERSALYRDLTGHWQEEGAREGAGPGAGPGAGCVRSHPARAVRDADGVHAIAGARLADGGREVVADRPRGQVQGESDLADPGPGPGEGQHVQLPRRQQDVGGVQQVGGQGPVDVPFPAGDAADPLQ